MAMQALLQEVDMDMLVINGNRAREHIAASLMAAADPTVLEWRIKEPIMDESSQSWMQAEEDITRLGAIQRPTGAKRKLAARMSGLREMQFEDEEEEEDRSEMDYDFEGRVREILAEQNSGMSDDSGAVDCKWARGDQGEGCDEQMANASHVDEEQAGGGDWKLELQVGQEVTVESTGVDEEALEEKHYGCAMGTTRQRGTRGDCACRKVRTWGWACSRRPGSMRANCLDT